MANRKHVVITNDDGIHADGLLALVEIFSNEYEVTVVAPLVEQSGKGHSFTYKTGVTCQEVTIDGVKAYAINGTPADCIKVAFSHILSELPDFVISGINFGENLGIANFYSGTVGAAREALFWHIPSIAFSTCYDREDDINNYAKEALRITQSLEEQNLLRKDLKHYYNVNFPTGTVSNAKGIKICRQSMAYYNDKYTVEEIDGEEVLFVNGNVVEVEDSQEFDIAALRAGYITVTPLLIDATAYDVMDSLSFLNLRKEK